MNKDQIAGNWKQLRGLARETWGKLTDDDLKRIDGRRERLVGTIQERYGTTKEEASKKVDAFLQAMKGRFGKS